MPAKKVAPKKIGIPVKVKRSVKECWNALVEEFGLTRSLRSLVHNDDEDVCDEPLAQWAIGYIEGAAEALGVKPRDLVWLCGGKEK